MNFSSDFFYYCQSEYPNSGKASSYVKAITYLCDYMGINVDNIQTSDLKKIKVIQQFLSSHSSEFYVDFMRFLTSRSQASYLKNGFVRAAIPYLFKFYHFC